MLPNNMLGAIEPIDAGMLSSEQMSLPPVGDNYNQIRNMPTYGINPSAPPIVNGQVQEPMPQQPMTGMEKFQGVIDALKPISEMIDDENVRSVLPAEQYLKYKKEKEDQKQNRQNQLLDSMKLESDLKFRREQLDIQREENQIRREALLRGDSTPASIKQTDWYLNASEDERNIFDRVNKVGVEKVDIGSEIVLIDKSTGARVGSIPKELAPQDRPETKAAQARASAEGTYIGEASGKLGALEASMGGLYEVTNKLSKLGQIATYTDAGQIKDASLRQLGFEVPDSAAARTEYISTVDNEVLPLLRDTFGAAFTVVEGDRLRATLGNENLSPKEKDAALKSFITAKEREIVKLQKQTGAPINPPVNPNADSQPMGFDDAKLKRLEELRAKKARGELK